MLLQKASALSLGLLLAIALAPKPALLTRLKLGADSAQAQGTSASFPLPSSVPTGTAIRVDGSESMVVINQALKQKFEAQYAGTSVQLANQGTESALKAVLDGSIDLAAIGRPLTAAEIQQGLSEAPISREKIAIIMGSNNPFKGDLTFRQFAKIFRGEIKDWSEVGGVASPIRLVDRPESSDTRQALSSYSVFRDAPFQTGDTATQIATDDTSQVIAALGNDGISYAIANQVQELGQEPRQASVQIIPMHGTLPSNPRYPYSQPRGYVYKTASPAVAAFLGYANAPAGRQAIAAARSNEAIIATSPAALPPIASPLASPMPSPVASSPIAPSSATPVSSISTAKIGLGWLLWLILPLGLGVWWLLKSRSSQSPTVAPLPPVSLTVPPQQPPLSNPAVAEPAVAEPAVAKPVVVEPAVAKPMAVQQAIEPVAVDLPAALPPTAAKLAVAGAAGLGAAALGSAAVGSAAMARRSRIVLAARSAGQGYAYWEAPESEKAALRQQGGQQLTLRIADVTELCPDQLPHSIQDYACAESDLDRHVALPQTERDYIAEIGYLSPTQQWLLLARSLPIRVAEPAIAALESSPESPEVPAKEQSASPVLPPVAAVTTVAAVATATGSVAPQKQSYGVLPPFDAEQIYEPESASLSANLPDLLNLDAEALAALASVDENLPDLPTGYGESQIMLLLRDPQWVYAYWDAPDSQKQALRQQGGQRFALRFYDITDARQHPQSLQQYECDELARDWYIPVPLSDRDYVAELGYVTHDGRWLLLTRSNPVRVPPAYAADWYEEQFDTVVWESDLRGQSFGNLVSPTSKTGFDNPIYDQIFGLTDATEAQRVSGSLFGSMHQLPAVSFALASGIGMQTLSGAGARSGAGVMSSGLSMYASGIGSYAMSGIGMYTASGMGVSGIGMYTPSGMGMLGAGTRSGIGMSGIGMSGIGMSGAGIHSMSGIGMYTTSGMGISGAGIHSMSGIGMYTISGYSMSGIGMYTTSGMGMSGIGMYTTSGVGMSGAGMSGMGMSSSMPPRSRKFWMVGDAELIVYGATEPDATLTIGGRPVQLNPDGTFRFQMSFQDGLIDFPIQAVAADGEQNRAVHLKFVRETPAQNTNSKADAKEEPF